MGGIMFLAWFFVLGAGLIWMTHRALVAENRYYGLPAEPPSAQPAPTDVTTQRRAA